MIFGWTIISKKSCCLVGKQSDRKFSEKPEALVLMSASTISCILIQ